MSAVETSKEIRRAALDVAASLGYDYHNGDMLETELNPLIKQAAYDAGRGLAIKFHVAPRLIDKRTNQQKEDDAQAWLDDLTVSPAERNAIMARLITEEAKKSFCLTATE